MTSRDANPSDILDALRETGARLVGAAEATAIRNGATADDPPLAAVRAVTRIEAELLKMLETRVRPSADPASATADAPVTSERPGPAASRRTGTPPRRLTIGDTAPNFEADTTHGRLRFHDWLGDSWAVLFSHPGDFTPVSTTELGHAASVQSEFEKRKVKIIALSAGSVDSHLRWIADVRETTGVAPDYPVIGDPDLEVSRLYGMAPEYKGEMGEDVLAATPEVRNVFVIGPDKKIKLILIYPMTTGRNFDEVLRVIDSLQLTAAHRVATPVNWQPGEAVIIAGSVSDEEAKTIYPKGWDSPKPYIRIVPEPAD